jgi:protease-4
MAGEFHARFKQVVLQSRPHVIAAELTNFDGRVFSATQAKARGLIDGIGYLDDAIAAAEARTGQGNAAVVMFRRRSDPARSPYAITPNTPLQTNWLPLSIPGLERSQLPIFLYLWEIEPTLDR